MVRIATPMTKKLVTIDVEHGEANDDDIFMVLLEFKVLPLCRLIE